MADALFAGMLAVTGLVIIASMMSDVVEDVAVRLGVRSEGLLFSASGLLPKITAAIGAGVAGLMLAMVRFPAHAQPGTVGSPRSSAGWPGSGCRWAWCSSPRRSRSVLLPPR